jgi:rhamnose transport system permease protein
MNSTMTSATESRPASATSATWLAVLAAPELMVAILLCIALIVGASLEKFFNAGYLLHRSSLFMEVGVMALGMSFVIIGGNIDLSCASMLALVGAAITTLWVRCHVPFVLLICLAPLMGALLGGINGVIVAKLKLPSLVITLGTMAAYRGLAQVLIGDHSEPVPKWFIGLNRITLVDSPIAMPLVIFLAMAVVLGLILHRTVFGRWVFAMGTNSDAALYAGVPVTAVTIGCFVLSGVLSSLAALMLMSRLGVARYDHASGQELDVITAVVLGGASIFGGRGTVFGTVLALLLVGVLQTAMGVANIPSQYQTTANGGLLIFAVLASNGLAWVRRK